MTPEQELKFNEMHETLIKINSGLVPKVVDLEHTIYGNGRPGIKEELAKLQVSHQECAKRQSKPAQWPAIVAAVCAVAAVLIPLMIGAGK